MRRDLEFLEAQDLLVRVHGAVLSSAAAEPNLLQKSRSAVEAKRGIAQRASALIPAEAVVFIDSGTTCLEAARVLRTREDLTIITNCLPVIAGHEQFRARLLVLGGERRAVSGALVGGVSRLLDGMLRADVALIGTSGLEAKRGPGTSELMEAEIKRAWIEQARRAILLRDATKCKSSAPVGFAKWADFNDFVTDQAPSEELSHPYPSLHLP